MRIIDGSSDVCSSDLQVRSLLKIIFQPIWEIRNAQGRPSYALFLRRLNNTTGMPTEWRRAADRAPVTSEKVHYLRNCMSGVSTAAQDFRILLVNSLLLDAFWKTDKHGRVSSKERVCT